MEKNNKMTLTEEQIIKGNELIMRFMHYKDNGTTIWWNPPASIANNNMYIGYTEYSAKYHSDYNWSMAVVERIDEIGFDVQISRISVKISRILENDKPIVSLVCGNISKKNELLFQAVVEFITWYNENKD